MSPLIAGVGKHALRKRGDDFYETSDVATRALLKHERIPPRVWEPACGKGAIVRVLREMGHHVTATDLVDRGCPDSESRIDFLLEWQTPAGVESIVTNPPYKNAAAFVEHGLALVPHVVLLLRLAFLESESRRAIFDSGHLARVLVFRNRLPMMHRDGWDGNRASNPTAFAWFIFDRNHRGATELQWISWEPTP